jgi:hypothetical protein
MTHPQHPVLAFSPGSGAPPLFVLSDPANIDQRVVKCQGRWIDG